MQCSWLFAVSLVLALSTCGKNAETKDEKSAATAENHVLPTEPQWFRIEVEAHSGKVPFLLEVQWPLQTKSVARLANGAERIALDMSCKGSACEVSVPILAAALELSFESEETLVGVWRRSDYYSGGPVTLFGEAVDGPESEHRYVKHADPSVDVGGKWVLAIDGVGPGKAEFVQNEDGTVQGWILPTNIGDVRYLDGRVEGTTLRLSTFNGQHAYNITLTVAVDGRSLEGVWHFHTIWHYPIKGWRGDEPTLDDLHTLRLRPGKTTVDIPELAALKGKPVDRGLLRYVVPRLH
ncbi:MAG: hypothetical protein GY811_18940 [Myxococcales bacterium]|nr:hypothetical protein [Myxococcales bacterium]